MPKQKKGSRGGRTARSGTAARQPSRTTATRTNATRSSRQQQRQQLELAREADDTSRTIEHDTAISSLQLGHFLELVRMEVRQEMQSHQGHLDESGSRSGDAPLPTSSQSSQVAAAQPPSPLIAAAFRPPASNPPASNPPASNPPASNQPQGSVNTCMHELGYILLQRACTRLMRCACMHAGRCPGLPALPRGQGHT